MKKLFLLPFFILISTFIIILISLINNSAIQNRFKHPNIKQTPASQFSAWIPYWDQKSALSSLNESGNKLSTISPMWYFLDEKSLLTMAEKINQEEFKIKAKELNIKILPAVSNQFNPEKVSKLINNPELSKKFINDLIDKAYEQNYQGWDIDFEEIKITDTNAYNKFINDLAFELHNNKLLIAVSVHAQREGKIEREASLVQDWIKLSKTVDFIKIMAYDFHNGNTSPGPVTPLTDYTLILKKAIKTIPVEKIVIGLPLYGYNWSTAGNTSLLYSQAVNISQQFSQNLIRDKDSYALVLKYKDNNINHVIWVEDSVSTMKKIEIARSFGIYQFCFWRLGGEDLILWKKL